MNEIDCSNDNQDFLLSDKELDQTPPPSKADPRVLTANIISSKIIPNLANSLVIPTETFELANKMQEISQAYVAHFISIQDALHETMQTISNNLGRLTGDFINNVGGVAVNVLTPLNDAINTLASINPNIDWDRFEQIAISWGRYGWTGIEYFENSELPTSQAEADVAAYRLIRTQMLNSMIQEIKNDIRKQKDFEEALFLFETKMYKSCCMMLFSLIECELLKRSKKKEGDKYRLPSRAYDQIQETAKDNTILLISTKGTPEAFKHLFSSGDDFNREKETDINRNFLMHGMRYKPVRKYHCIKLFMLLHETLQIMHWYK